MTRRELPFFDPGKADNYEQKLSYSNTIRNQLNLIYELLRIDLFILSFDDLSQR